MCVSLTVNHDAIGWNPAPISSWSIVLQKYGCWSLFLIHVYYSYIHPIFHFQDYYHDIVVRYT